MADLAKLYRVHLRTAQRWAAEDKWRRTMGKPVKYSVADAQQSYEQRRDHGRQRRAARPGNTRLATALEHP
jgi:hypothetical protein